VEAAGCAATVPATSELIADVAARVCDLAVHRLRVVVDGLTAAGKTTFADELAVAIRRDGRSTPRASLDDFKQPWRHARQQGYDRTSGEGYYRNAPDFDAARTLLLGAAGPTGTGRVVLCAHDPLTGVDHRSSVVHAPDDAVLIVDGVFAMRPEYDAFWDLRICLDVAPDDSLQRGVARDARRDGYAEALRVHTTRYRVAEQLYMREVHPQGPDIVIDNTNFTCPRIVRAWLVAVRVHDLGLPAIDQHGEPVDQAEFPSHRQGLGRVRARSRQHDE
jgi:uridine kinase